MKGREDRSLLIGVILLVLILSAITWFLGVSPRLSAAAEAREATQIQRDANEVSRLTLEKRQSDAALVPENREAIYDIRALMPPTEEVPDWRRFIDQIVAETGVVLLQDVVSTAIPVPGGISLAAQMEAVGLTSEIEGLAFTSLVATPEQIIVLGGYTNLLSFLDALQLGGHRYFLLSGVSLEVSGAEGTGGSVAIQATLDGFVFTLDPADSTISVPPPERPWPGTGQEPEPVPNPNNPFGG
jgi:hypothetical protein